MPSLSHFTSNISILNEISWLITIIIPYDSEMNLLFKCTACTEHNIFHARCFAAPFLLGVSKYAFDQFSKIFVFKN